MNFSPTKPKTRVVRELSSAIQKSKKERSPSSKQQASKRSGKNTLTDHSLRLNKPSVDHMDEQSFGNAEPAAEVPRFPTINQTFDPDVSISSRKNQSFREKLWDDSIKIGHLVKKIQKRAGLPQQIKEYDEPGEIYDNIMDESVSDIMMTNRQSRHSKDDSIDRSLKLPYGHQNSRTEKIPPIDLSKVSMKLKIKKKRKSSRGKDIFQSDNNLAVKFQN
jgi:hypothetical protein